MNTNYCAELIDSLTHKHHVNSTLYCAEINQAIKFRLPITVGFAKLKLKIIGKQHFNLTSLF